MIIVVIRTVSKDVIVEEYVVKNVVKKYEISLINLSINEISMKDFHEGVKKTSTKEFQKSILMKSFFNHSGDDLLKMSSEKYEKTVKEYNERMEKQFGSIKNNSIKLSKIYFIDDYNACIYTIRESTIHTSDDQQNVQLFVLRKYQLVRENYRWFINNSLTNTKYFNEGDVNYNELKNLLIHGDNEIKFDHEIM